MDDNIKPWYSQIAAISAFVRSVRVYGSSHQMSFMTHRSDEAFSKWPAMFPLSFLCNALSGA